MLFIFNICRNGLFLFLSTSDMYFTTKVRFGCQFQYMSWQKQFSMLFLFNICNGSRFPLLFSDIFHNVNRFLFYIFIISIITGFDVSSNSCLFLMCNGSWFLFLSISRFEYPFPLFFSCVLSSLVSLGLLFCICVCYPLNENMFTHGYEKRIYDTSYVRRI